MLVLADDLGSLEPRGRILVLTIDIGLGGFTFDAHYLSLSGKL